jgi:hypothetical protein
MKKPLILVGGLLAGICISAATPAGAVVNCTSNIVDGSAAYDAATSTLSGTIQTGTDSLTPAPSCKSVSYNAIISYVADSTHVVQVAPQKGDGASFVVHFSFSSVTSDTGTFCVALSGSKGNTVYDTAPSTADLAASPTPQPDTASPNGFSCGSGWVAINSDGSSGGGASSFAG